MFLGKMLYSQGASLHPGVEMGSGEMLGSPCDGLASHPGGSRNTPSCFMLRKLEISAGLRWAFWLVSIEFTFTLHTCYLPLRYLGVL